MRQTAFFAALLLAGCVDDAITRGSLLAVDGGGADAAALDAAAATDASVADVDAASADLLADGARPVDAGGADASPDAARPECQWAGAPGTCKTAAACAAVANHTAEPGSGCASGLACCIQTPSVANNPPVPAGWKLMMQSQVTPAMTTWAVMILHDPITYPMFSTTTRTFGTLLVLARVEWHPPDFQNSVIHRGVTLYVPQ
jgi:hypothetical protein